MGGMGGSIAQTAAKDVGTGLSNGWRIGSGYANAQYNAASLRQQAESVQNDAKYAAFRVMADADWQAHLISKQYQSEYSRLLEEQTRQQSMNRVYAMKRGITGASASAVMGAYAAKGQRNLDTLYYNAAMRTAAVGAKAGQEVTASARSAYLQAAALEEKARQYDWLGTQTLIGGALQLATGFFESAITEASGPNESPIAQVSKEEGKAVDDALDAATSSGTGGAPTTASGGMDFLSGYGMDFLSDTAGSLPSFF